MKTKESYRVREVTKVYKFPTFESQLPDLINNLRAWHMGNVRYPMIDLLQGRTEQELIVVNNDSLFEVPVIRILTKDMLLGVFKKMYERHQDMELNQDMTLRDFVETYFGDMREIKRNEYSNELVYVLLEEAEPPTEYEDPSMKIAFQDGEDVPRHVSHRQWIESRRLEEQYPM